MIINGASRSGSSLFQVVDPGTEAIIAEVPLASTADVDDAVSSAVSSFEDGVWSEQPAAHRSRVLWRMADLLEEHSEEIAKVEALNQGAPYREIRDSRIPEAARVLRYYAGWADKITGVALDLRRPGAHAHAYTQRKPVGVVGLITPWNNPLGMAVWKVAPALAAGCSCILKPSENTPLSSIMLGELALEAGLPPGVLNIVTGDGPTAGRHLAEHPRVDKISFTGSTETGRQIVQGALGNLKKVALELGGKSPVLVFDDADLEDAARGAAGAIFSNAGQVCTAGSRLLIADGIYDDVVSQLVRHAGDLPVGYSFDERSRMGPLISSQQLRTVTSYIESALDDGARVLTGGHGTEQGYFMAPTVITDVTARMPVVREEIFGPVVAAMRFKDEEDAVRLANETSYGLAASVWTSDVKRAHRVARQLRVGRVGINVHGWPDTTMPTGGFKESGWGRELGSDGLDAYLETTSVFTKL